MNVIRWIVLAPVNLIYGMVVWIRNRCYDWNLLPVKRFDVPVISVGNRVVGGGGKSPFVIALAHHLESQYSHIVVLSRGYGRVTRGPLIVSRQGSVLLTPDQAGDEPIMIAQKCPDISVIVAEKRFQARSLIARLNADLVILDDGFQHRALHRDVNILLEPDYLNARERKLLPLGRCRETVQSYERADLKCRSKSSGATSENEWFHIIYEMVFPPMLPGTNICVVSALADNAVFYRKCVDYYGVDIDHIGFRDHHIYQLSDFVDIRSDVVIITTAKDEVKLKNISGLRNTVAVVGYEAVLTLPFLQSLNTLLSR